MKLPILKTSRENVIKEWNLGLAKYLVMGLIKYINEIANVEEQEYLNVFPIRMELDKNM